MRSSAGTRCRPPAAPTDPTPSGGNETSRPPCGFARRRGGCPRRSCLCLGRNLRRPSRLVGSPDASADASVVPGRFPGCVFGHPLLLAGGPDARAAARVVPAGFLDTPADTPVAKRAALRRIPASSRSIALTRPQAFGSFSAGFLDTPANAPVAKRAALRRIPASSRSIALTRPQAFGSFSTGSWILLRMPPSPRRSRLRTPYAPPPVPARRTSHGPPGHPLRSRLHPVKCE
jgi:hypothetical protein